MEKVQSWKKSKGSAEKLIVSEKGPLWHQNRAFFEWRAPIYYYIIYNILYNIPKNLIFRAKKRHKNWRRAHGFPRPVTRCLFSRLIDCALILEILSKKIISFPPSPFNLEYLFFNIFYKIFKLKLTVIYDHFIYSMYPNISHVMEIIFSMKFLPTHLIFIRWKISPVFFTVPKIRCIGGPFS